jgi:hypothetical protein
MNLESLKDIKKWEMEALKMEAKHPIYECTGRHNPEYHNPFTAPRISYLI